MKNAIADFSELDAMKDHPVSAQIDDIFRSVIKEEKKVKAPLAAAAGTAAPEEVEELSLSSSGEFELDLGGDDVASESSPLDDGLDLSLGEEESLDLAADDYQESGESDYGDISLADEEFSLDAAPEEEVIEDLGEISLGDDEAPTLPEEDSLSLDGMDLDAASLDLGEDPAPDLDAGLDLGGDELSLSSDEGLSLGDDEVSLSLGGEDEFSDDAMKKLEEIDAIMVEDASRVDLSAADLSSDENLDEPLVGDDLNLDSISFGSEEPEEPVVKETKKTKKKEEAAPSPQEHRNFSADLKELSGAYSGEMERLQATISNLRSDREELLNRIQKLEDEKILQNRQHLSVRAELDEKKIELTIIRKKLNEEINELKDRLKLHDEKRLILEEKNKVLQQELDKAAQKNKIDVKKVQMRERELEQKLELLKADAETQIRNRDLKILELKRKIDSMEFDMESLSQQEKRSVESRFELEDKLEKAIKTLRTAINVLEDEDQRSGALNALKKNLEV